MSQETELSQETQQMQRSAALVSSAGGRIDYVTPDGEVLLSVAVPPGAATAGPFIDLCPSGAIMDVQGTIAVIPPRSFHGRQRYGEGSHDTGANPDFQPSSADRMQRELRLTLARMQQATSRVEARERALASIERIPTREPDPEPVIEAEDITPEPAPAK